MFLIKHRIVIPYLLEEGLELRANKHFYIQILIKTLMYRKTTKVTVEYFI